MDSDVQQWQTHQNQNGPKVSSEQLKVNIPQSQNKPVYPAGDCNETLLESEVTQHPAEQ